MVFDSFLNRSPTDSASFLIPERNEQPELLDQGVGSTADVRHNLKEIGRINRYLGGTRALTRHLFPLLRQSSAPITVVDIGAGSGEIASYLASWAKRNGLHVTICAVDISERNLSAARENIVRGVYLVQADARALPFVEHQVDYIISTLVLHHFDPDQVIGILRESYRRSRRGIVMSDLIRGYLPLLAFRLIQPVFARHYLTRHDGKVSIRRAYTPDELRVFAQAAGIESARVYSHFLWRMTLVAEKPRV